MLGFVGNQKENKTAVTLTNNSKITYINHKSEIKKIISNL